MTSTLSYISHSIEIGNNLSKAAPLPLTTAQTQDMVDVDVWGLVASVDQIHFQPPSHTHSTLILMQAS